MAIGYSYSITSVRVVTQDGLVDVVKEVEVNVTGTDGAAKFEHPITLDLADADPNNFIAFPSLTEAQLVSWIENHPLLEGLKSHIAFIVAKEVEKLAMEQKPLPWAPAPEPTA
jgi:hypothetical protein